MNNHTPNEKWVWAKGHEGIYQVSNMGNVRSFRQGSLPRDMKLVRRGNTGYLGIGLRDKDGNVIQHYIHRLVLQSFVGGATEGQEASHLDGDKSNNCLDNLLWETRADNHKRKQEHGTLLHGSAIHNSKITSDDAVAIREKYRIGHTAAMLSKEYGLAYWTIKNIVYGKTWKRAGGPIATANENNKGSNHGNSKLDENAVMEIRKLMKKDRNNRKHLAKKYGVRPETISYVNSGRGWTHV